MTKDLRERMATLANGAAVPISKVVAVLGKLDRCLSQPDSEWEVVFYLRELCFGREVEPEHVRALIAEGLLDEDGRLESGVRDVVLSAVRGEGRSLHLDSPFTDPDARSVANFLNGRDYISSFLPEDEAKVYLDAANLEDQIRQVLRSQEEAARPAQTDPRSSDGELPPISESMIDRILRNSGIRKTPRPGDPPADDPPADRSR
jgi:hypothetical protein